MWHLEWVRISRSSYKWFQHVLVQKIVNLLIKRIYNLGIY